MSSNFYTETHTYREGRILLYKRPNSQNFQCRLRVEGIKGYTIKSCDTPNQGRALKFAEDLYDNLRFKKLNNLPLETRTFRQIFDEWFKKADKSEYRQDFYQGRAKLYLFPYFGDYKIEEITENIIDDYWSWRKNYYKDNPEKVKGRIAEKPSNQSLKMEKTAILEILEYAHRRGYIRTVPKINFNPRTKTESRDTFSQDEMVKLLNSFKKWSSQAKKSSDIYQRKMIYYLIVFLINSGIRPNEFYKIRWKDIIVHTQDGLKTLYVSISDNTKTGKRVVVCLPEAYTCYNAIKGFSKYTKADDLFFTNYDGSCMKNWSKTYIDKLKEMNLYISDDGKARPPYSLRHYYATQRLLDGVQVYDLAKNMGTSVKQIENHYGHILATQKSVELIQGAPKSFYQQKEEFIEDMGFKDVEKDIAAISDSDNPLANEKLKQWQDKIKKSITKKDKELFDELVKKY